MRYYAVLDTEVAVMKKVVKVIAISLGILVLLFALGVGTLKYIFEYRVAEVDTSRFPGGV